MLGIENVPKFNLPTVSEKWVADFQTANVLWTHHLTTIVGIIAETVVAEISLLAPYVIFVLL